MATTDPTIKATAAPSSSNRNRRIVVESEMAQPKIDTENPERAIVGPSAAVEAEYAIRSDSPFSLAEAIESEIYSIEGFSTLEAAVASARLWFPANRIEILG